MRGWLWTVLVIAVVGLALLAGWLLNERAQNDPRRWAEAEMMRMETQRQQAEAAYFLPLQVALYAGLAVVGVGAAGLLAWAGYLYARRRAQTIYPDRHGVLPAVILRPGEMLVDAGALAGPLVVGAAGPEYRLPPAAVPQLQAGANQGAALTRTMRAWATHPAGPGTRPATTGAPFLALPPAHTFPPVEQLTGDENEILRLLAEGRE
ncbi:MAG: hypothetical protein JW900_04910 [Anaerolineae bacterium]|nr:hypothetical protein [Anaerolineae bacterium]